MKFVLLIKILKMRFDNPIKNHQFKELPDIASFSEVKNEYRNNNLINLSKLEKALKDLNQYYNFLLSRMISFAEEVEAIPEEKENQE